MRRREKVFDGEAVRGMLEGRKSQFRVLLDGHEEGLPLAVGDRIRVREDWAAFWGPRHPGGRVVTEGSVLQADGRVAEASVSDPLHVYYAADERPEGPARFEPAEGMPAWASRITLSVTATRVGRLQDLTEADAEAEGMAFDIWDQALAVRDYSGPGIKWLHMWSTHEGEPGYVDEDEIWRASFRTRWEAEHGPGSWEANPLVMVVCFDTVVEGGPAGRAAAWG